MNISSAIKLSCSWNEWGWRGEGGGRERKGGLHGVKSTVYTPQHLKSNYQSIKAKLWLAPVVIRRIRADEFETSGDTPEEEEGGQ